VFSSPSAGQFSPSDCSFSGGATATCTTQVTPSKAPGAHIVHAAVYLDQPYEHRSVSETTVTVESAPAATPAQ